MADTPDNDDILGGGMLSQDELDALLAAASAETAAAGGEDWLGAGNGGNLPVAGRRPRVPPEPLPVSVDTPSFDGPAFGGSVGPEPAGLSRVRDIPLEVTVELGRTRLLIRDILDLGSGSIIELDKIAGEPVDLFANGLLVARGEVVVIDDNFGVRVTEIITAAERKGGKEADALAA